MHALKTRLPRQLLHSKCSYLRVSRSIRVQTKTYAMSETTDPTKILHCWVNTTLQRYLDEAPAAKRALHVSIMGQEDVVHDHLAFRTYGVPGLGIDSLLPVFESFGYVAKDRFPFPGKKLRAVWMAPPDGMYEVLPRMFISELEVPRLSPISQAIIHQYTEPLKDMTPLQIWTALMVCPRPWALPSYHHYQELMRESEYAAWVLVNGYSLNHTAISLHSLHHPDDIYDFSERLQCSGFEMNKEGGLVKVSPDGALLQSSTVADTKEIEFSDGEVHRVAGAYMEFVERRPLAQFSHLPVSELKEHMRRDGFEVGNADKIFESTTLTSAVRH